MFEGVEFFVSFRFAEAEQIERGGWVGGVLLFQGVEAGEEDLLFGDGGLACEDESESVFEAGFGLRRGEEDAFGEGAAALRKLRRVKEFCGGFILRGWLSLRWFTFNVRRDGFDYGRISSQRFRVHRQPSGYLAGATSSASEAQINSSPLRAKTC